MVTATQYSKVLCYIIFELFPYFNQSQYFIVYPKTFLPKASIAVINFVSFCVQLTEAVWNVKIKHKKKWKTMKIKKT